MVQLIRSRAVVAGLLLGALALSIPWNASRAANADEGDSTYYYNRGRRIAIRSSATRVALRVPERAKTSDLAARLAAAPGVVAARDVRAGGLVEVTVAQAKARPAEVDELAAEVGAEVLPVFVEGARERDESTLFVTDELLVQFKPDVSESEVASWIGSAGLEIVESLRYAPNGYKLRVPEAGGATDALTAANELFETGACLFAHPNFLAHRSVRYVPNDPQFANQWHLNNKGQGGGKKKADVRAKKAWDTTQGSPDISIAVADTGIDFEHEDFAVTIDGVPKVHDPRDVVHGDDDPSPKPSDAEGSHGTAASGVAVAAADDGRNTAGIAPRCRFIPIQLYAESTFTPNSTEADAFTWAADHGADVMSNSWGPDFADTPLPDATRAAIDYATTTGREGKGVVIFFAAGNESMDIIHDNYSNYEGVIAVAASTNKDKRAAYSNFGERISVCAPSSGGTLGVVTTDVTGARGYSSGNFTTSFGGTSSSAPLVAGVAALVLSVDPSLTWQEVKALLEQTADQIDKKNGDYDASGHSPLYGFGRVNAAKAVQRASRGRS
jgi:subtilisin family serine protease